MRHIIVDTNLLVLFAVGLTDRSLIEKHKRLKEYEEADFDLLAKVLKGFDQILVTPHILTETCNLISQTNERTNSSIMKKLAILLGEIKEEFQQSVEVAKHDHFPRLGLTDCAILELLTEGIHLITVDAALYLEAFRKSPSCVVNFNHLRQNRLLGLT
ncbi:MAG: hypothetical protein HZB29_09625 [Nitrospinae bacterium]|nr:hypothetical protein [Nitrospinota bacterium]